MGLLFLFAMEQNKIIPEEKLNELINYLDSIYKDKSNYEIINNVEYPAILSKTAIKAKALDGIRKIFSYSIASTQKNSSYYRKGFHLIVYIYFN